MPKQDHGRTDLKSPKVPPLMVNCFKCGKEFGVKGVTAFKRYSMKNSGAYGTGETEGNKYMCDNCLINFRKNEKKLFWEKVKDPKKRNMMSSYTVGGHLVAS